MIDTTQKQITRTILSAVLVLFGLMAGFFYAFSVCIMPGLDTIDGEAAIRAMQGVNNLVRNPVFFITFFLTPLVTIVATAYLFVMGQNRSALYIGSAAVIYVAGVILPTRAINVPMNDALAVLNSYLIDTQARQIWINLSETWTMWNSIRAVVSTVCLVLVGLGLINAGNAPISATLKAAASS